MRGMAYLCKNRHGSNYARFIIPKHLQSHLNNKEEIRRPPQTDNTSERVKRIVDSLLADKTKIQADAEEKFVGDDGVTVNNTAFHSFRHVFCSYLVAHHIPEDLVIALSGHQYRLLAKSTSVRSGKGHWKINRSDKLNWLRIDTPRIQNHTMTLNELSHQA